MVVSREYCSFRFCLWVLGLCAAVVCCGCGCVFVAVCL